GYHPLRLFVTSIQRTRCLAFGKRAPVRSALHPGYRLADRSRSRGVYERRRGGLYFEVYAGATSLCRTECAEEKSSREGEDRSAQRVASERRAIAAIAETRSCRATGRWCGARLQQSFDCHPGIH